METLPEPVSLRSRLGPALARGYLVWLIPCAASMVLSDYMPQNGNWARIFAPIWLIFFLLAAGCALSRHLAEVEPLLKDRHALRRRLLLGGLLVWAGLYAIGRTQETIRPAIYLLNTAHLLVMGNVLGGWLVSPLRRMSELIPLGAVLLMADLFSVFRGPSKEIAETLEKFYKSGMEGPAPLVDFIILRIPVPGAERLMPVFGVSDWIAAAFLSAAAFRFGVRDNLVGPEPREGRPVDFFLPAASAGLLAALFLAWTIDRFVPALPVVVVVFLLVTALRRPARLRPTREDWKLLGGAVIVMGTLMGAVAWMRGPG
ncbi:MAG: hypothetical protein ACLFN9_09685 [Desulfococcaceae bacterium]